MLKAALTRTFAIGFGVIAFGVATPTLAQPRPVETPKELLATYETLADAILATRQTEVRLVRSILGAAKAHAQVELDRARAAIKANDAKASQAALENVAAAVAQIASEGDSSVGAVRKRLREGGHFANPAGEAQGLYDEGFVVVTKKAKQSFLDASKAIGQLARAPKADALEAEWAKVEAAWNSIAKTP